VKNVLDGTGLCIGVVQSRFNTVVCDQLGAACLAELIKLNVTTPICWLTVPGALEIPFALYKMVESTGFDALIALGAVIRGQTYHFEIVAHESAAGIQRVMLDHKIPIVNAVLTTHTEAQAHERVDSTGRSAAQVAVEMARLSAL
jgi:6,7-dimethyl-8-ribityllumazine synthase